MNGPHGLRNVSFFEAGPGVMFTPRAPLNWSTESDDGVTQTLRIFDAVGMVVGKGFTDVGNPEYSQAMEWLHTVCETRLP
jgi:hypothetical protein